MKRVSLVGFDFLLFGAIALLMVAGIMFIYSSSRDFEGVLYSNEHLKQIIWAATGLIIFFLVSFTDYARLARYSVYVYVAAIALLIVTLSVGKVVNGARSWLGFGDLGIQPSEFAKVATILALGTYLIRTGGGIQQLPRFLVAFSVVLLPTILIVVQPDLGTALVYWPIFLFMTFMAGARLRHLAYVFLCGLLFVFFSTFPALVDLYGEGMFAVLLNDPAVLQYCLLGIAVVAALSAMGYFGFRLPHFYWFMYFATLTGVSSIGAVLARRVLKDYQIMRLIVFLNPELDPLGAGWNIIQSLTAVGSGGLLGKGYLRGTQSHYRYLPQQSTDFIFSIMAEELGFVGSLFVLGVVLLILYRGLRTVQRSKDEYAVLVGVGILGMFFFHAVVNIGMAVGIMPVTGIPLLFLSYGGSSLWTALAGAGILNSISMSRFRR